MLCVLIYFSALSQNVGINSTGNSPDPSAGLDIDFNNKGVLLPRIALSSETDNSTISSPTEGLIIYNTTNTGSLTPGFYYWNGSKWSRLFDDENVWSLTGNNNTTPGTNFIGTTDNKDLYFKTNNNTRVVIDSDGRVGIGSSPQSCAALEVNSTTGGFIYPSMTETQRDAIASPVGGLTIFNTDNNCLQIYNNLSNRWDNIHCLCNTCPTSYNIESVSYNPVSGSGTTISLGDDDVSSAINIGFDFCFYGNTYSQIYISSNGFITFSSGQGSACCNGVATPNSDSPNNFIALNWTDLNPSSGGSISYFTTGSSPNRQFVVEFSNVPEYSNSGYTTSGQIVLNECGGDIYIYINSIDINSHTIMQGIENSTGSAGVGISGRNTVTGPVSYSNEGWHFYQP